MLLWISEASLLMFFFATGQRFRWAYRLSRRVHGKRLQALEDFADDCCKLSEYDGPIEEYWDYVVELRWQYRFMSLLILLILIIGMIWTGGDIPPGY